MSGTAQLPGNPNPAKTPRGVVRTEVSSLLTSIRVAAQARGSWNEGAATRYPDALRALTEQGYLTQTDLDEINGVAELYGRANSGSGAPITPDEAAQCQTVARRLTAKIDAIMQRLRVP